MRTSRNEYDKTGRLINGHDYENQAWVIDGKYVRCGHPESMDCGCYGRKHEGEATHGKALKWEYDIIWERIVTHDSEGAQRVVFDLTGDSDELRARGPVLVARLNELRGVL